MNTRFIKTRNFIGALIFLVMMVSLVMPSFNASAVGPADTSDLYVAKTGRDTYPGTAAQPFLTIQHAVDVATPGDTISVAAGTYVETVKIDRSLTLIGDPGAIIKPDNGTPKYEGTRRPAIFVDGVNNVTIQGFEIDGTGGEVNYGIYPFNSNNTTVKNNFVHDITTLVGGVADDSAGVGIIYFGWDQGVDGALVQDNTVYNTGRMGIGVSGMRGSPFAFLVSNSNTINHNIVYNAWQGPTADNGGAVQINCGKNSIYENNTIHGTGLKYGILVAGSSTGNSITGNEIYNTAAAIKIKSNLPEEDCDFGTDSPGAPVVHLNNLHNNVTYGVWNVDTAPAFLVNAENNWWGNASGPSGEGPGTGDPVSTNVDYSPWWGANYVGNDHSTAWSWYTNDSIQDGIDAASAGDTVHVLAGTYALVSAVSVNKQVTLEGAQFGVDARTRGAVPESIVEASGLAGFPSTAFAVQAGISGAVIDGFTVQGAHGGQGVGGIYLAVGSNGTTVQNNIIQNNHTGVFLANNSAVNRTVIKQNLFRDNTATGPNSGNGIYADEITASTNLQNVLIQDNTFTNTSPVTSSSPLSLYNFSAIAFTNITFQGNQVSNMGSGIRFYGTTIAVVTGNIFDQTGVAGASNFGIAIYQFNSSLVSNADFTITDNQFTNISQWGIRVYGSADVPPAYTGTLHPTGNTFTGSTTYYLANQELGSTTTVIDATGNTYNGVLLDDSTTLPQLYAIADKVLDAVDVSTYGKVILKPGNVYVTPNSFYSTPTTTPSIQRAIDAASAGDTVNVAAGTYFEKVTIEKPIILLGPNVGIDPNTGSRLPEAIIDGGRIHLTSGSASVQIVSTTAGPVTFDGFTIQNAAESRYDEDREGIYIGATTHPVTIRNNRFDGWADTTAYDMGIYAANGAGSHVTIQSNKFTSMWRGILFETPLGSVSILNNGFLSLNAADTYTPRGVQFMTYSGKDLSELVAINGNTFSGYNGSGILLYGGYPGSAGAKFTNVEIKDNEINCIGSGPDWHMGILLRNTATTLGDAPAGGVHNVTISGNNITGTGGANSYGIVLRGQNTNITIESNTISALAKGIAVEEETAGAGFASGVVVHLNSLTGNTIAIINNSTDPTEIVNAENNWWGAVDGPGPVGPGSGDHVSLNVDFAPFCTNPDCTPPFAPAASTLTANAASGTYGGTVTLSATLLSGTAGFSGEEIFFTLNGVDVGSAITDGSGVASLSGASLDHINAGSYPAGVGADFAGDDNFTASSDTAALTVAMRPITVTAVHDEKVYDGNTSSDGVPTITAGALVTGDTAVWTQTYANRFIGTGKTLIPAGSVDDGVGGANYDVTFVNNFTGVITAASLLTADAASGTYGGTVTLSATLEAGGVAVSGRVIDFTLNGVPAGSATTDADGFASLSGASLDHINAGSYPTGVGASFAAGDPSYGAATDTAVLTVNKRLITVTAATNTKGYDGNRTAAAVPTLTGGTLVGADNITGFTETYDTKNVGTGKTLTPAGTVNDGNGGNNYTVTLGNNTTGVITSRDLTVTATGVDKTYNGTTAATVTLSDNRVAGDIFTDSYIGASFGDEHVGTGKAVAVTGISISGTDAGNYTLLNTTADTTADITQRALIVSATGVDKVYDNTTDATVTLSDNRVAGDVFTDSYIGASFINEHVGTGKAVAVTGISISGADAGNYTFNTTAGTTANITAKPITVTAITNTKQYDGLLTAAAIPTNSGVAAGDTANFSEAYNNKNVGSGNKTLVPSGTVTDGNSGNNYSYTFNDFTTGTITKKPITVTAVTSTKVYSGTTSSSGIPMIAPALATGDTSGFTQTFDNANVGTGKTLTPAGSASDGNSGANYDVTFANNTTGAITKAPLNVTAGNKTIIDGQADPAFTYVITGYVNGETSAVIDMLPTCSAAGHTGTGAFPIACSGGFDNNYSFAYTAGTLTVNATSAPANVQATDGLYTDKVKVTWNASPSASFYNIYRADSAGGLQSYIGTSFLTSYDDFSAVPGFTYYYYVKASSGTSYSPFSAYNTGWRNFPAATNVQATDGSYADRVGVSWNVSIGATYYRVYRATSATGTLSLLPRPAGTTFNDMTATPGVTYYYWVKACNITGCSDFSAYGTGWRMLSAPTNVQASDGTYTLRVRVSWNAPIGATSYRVYRSISAGGVKKLLNSSIALAYNDYTATSGVPYYYWLRACNGANCSGYSAYNTGWWSH